MIDMIAFCFMLVVSLFLICWAAFGAGYSKAICDQKRAKVLREDPDWTPGIKPPRPWPEPRPMEVEDCHIEPEKPWETE